MKSIFQGYYWDLKDQRTEAVINLPEKRGGRHWKQFCCEGPRNWALWGSQEKMGVVLTNHNCITSALLGGQVVRLKRAPPLEMMSLKYPIIWAGFFVEIQGGIKQYLDFQLDKAFQEGVDERCWWETGHLSYRIGGKQLSKGWSFWEQLVQRRICRYGQEIVNSS